MTHWSQSARDSANATMGSDPVDGAVRECIDSDWEPLAEIDELPDWELRAEIEPDSEVATSPGGPSGPAAGPGA